MNPQKSQKFRLYKLTETDKIFAYFLDEIEVRERLVNVDHTNSF